MSSGLVLAVRRSRRALWRRAHDEIVATTSSDENVHRLTGGAAAVWEELAVPQSRAQLLARIAFHHDVAPSDVQPQVTACIDDLKALGLVEEMAAADA